MKSNFRSTRLAMILALSLFGGACSTMSSTMDSTMSAIEGGPLTPAQAEEKKKALIKLRDSTLHQLIALHPQIRAEMAAGVGYGVFSANQYNVLFVIAGEGSGVITDAKTHKTTYMRVSRLGTGPGAGYKSYRQLIIFKDQTLYDTFRTIGADVTASADATFKLGNEKGIVLDGSVSANPLISSYQITDDGVLLQANWGGVTYLPDVNLNDPSTQKK